MLWHGAHNLFVQQIFYDLTKQYGSTSYFIDDFGIGVTLASVILGISIWVWRARQEEEATLP